MRNVKIFRLDKKHTFTYFYTRFMADPVEKHETVRTTITLPEEILFKGREKAASELRSFPKYVQLLIERDLRRAGIPTDVDLSAPLVEDTVQPQ